MKDFIHTISCSGMGLLPGKILTDVECTDGISVISSDPSEAQLQLHDLDSNAPISGLLLTLQKCQTLLQGWVGSPTGLILDGYVIEVVDQLSYPGSVINLSRLTTEKVNACVHNSRGYLCRPQPPVATMQHLYGYKWQKLQHRR